MPKVITCVTFRMIDEDGTVRHVTYKRGDVKIKADGTKSTVDGIIIGNVTSEWKEEEITK